MLESSLTQSIPQFSKSKHKILCSELKQLYVAVTRTRQRLWFCEDVKEHSGPMFEYWKKKCVVQVQQLDDSIAQSMQASSSKEDWRAQGFKLYHEHNYKMATLCFERAEDAYWERRSKASGLKAYADDLRNVNPAEANAILREAAQIFEAIGKADSAAQCFFDVREFERAGVIFLEKCGDSELDRAGECFFLAGCYDRAADVYARGNFFSECLNACTKGKLFDMGLQYILSWKHDIQHDCRASINQEIGKLEQEFLENCARHYHSCGDNRSMMKSVNTFHNIDLMRNFLMSLNCLDELIFLEEELGNFLEAANIAKPRGDPVIVADLLGKAGKFTEASMLLLQYVLANSLWSPGSKGWPLKTFKQKKELLEKAKSISENDSKKLYEYVCAEANILSDEDQSLDSMRGYLTASKRHNNVRGEMISVRKILDVHLHLNSSKYTWEDELVSDLIKHSEGMISTNQVSIETTVYFWNCWKDNVLNLFESLQCLATQDANPYGEFCLNFFGVWRQNSNYILLNSDPDWVRKVDGRFLHRNDKSVSIDVGQFIASARNYWCSELHTLGIKILENFACLYKFSNKNRFSTYRQCKLLIHMFEVAKFLLESKHLKHGYHDKRKLETFRELATGGLHSYLFPPDCKVSLQENMVSLRATSSFQTLQNEFIAENIGLKNQPTYDQVGRVTMMILGSGKVDKKLCEKIVSWLGEIPPWSAFIGELYVSMSAENQQGLPTEMLVWRFHEALRDTYNANWRHRDYISPFCFMYLVERLLIMVSSFQGYFITTKSSFVEWQIYHQGKNNTNFILGAQTQRSFQATLEFFANIIPQFLFNMNATIDWTKRTHVNVKEYYPILVRRLVVVTCLLHINFGICFDILRNMLGYNFITEHLPLEFRNALKRKRKFNVPTDNLNMFAEFFNRIGNPMVIVSLAGNHRQFICRDAILIDMKINHSMDDVMTVLFPKEAKTSQSQNGAPVVKDGNNTIGKTLAFDRSKPGKITQLPSSSCNLALEENKDMKSNCENGGNPPMRVDLWEIFEAFTMVENERDQRSLLSNASQIKMNVEKWILHLTVSRNNEQETPLEVDDILHELNLLSTALTLSEPEINISQVGSISKSLYSRKMDLEPILNKLLNEDHITTEAGSQNVDGHEHSEQACNSGHAETTELESVKASQVKSNLQETDNHGKGKPKPKPKPKPKKNKGKGHRH